jgi:hypothetical protein
VTVVDVAGDADCVAAQASQARRAEYEARGWRVDTPTVASGLS